MLADDHAKFRQTLRRLLDAEKSVGVLGEVSDLPSAIEHVHRYRPRVLVLDLECRADRQSSRSGGCARRWFVFKDRAETELAEAVHRAAHGAEYVSTSVAPGLDVLRRTADGGRLSPREVELLRLIALGYTSVEIAAKLRLSRRTVETHRARILQQLELRTRAELVRFALDRHLIGV